MSGEKAHLLAGMALGILLSALFFFYFAPRYETVRDGEVIIKQDKWTGRFWRLADGEWGPAGGEANHDWEEIDRALVTALKLPFPYVDTHRVLTSLQEKYPVMTGLNEEELMERLHLIYLRQVLLKMYVDELLTAEPQEE